MAFWDYLRVVNLSLTSILFVFLAKMMWDHFRLKRTGPYKSTILIIISMLTLCMAEVVVSFEGFGDPFSLRIPLSVFGTCVGIFAAYRRNQELDVYHEGKVKNKVNEELDRVRKGLI